MFPPSRTILVLSGGSRAVLSLGKPYIVHG